MIKVVVLSQSKRSTFDLPLLFVARCSFLSYLFNLFQFGRRMCKPSSVFCKRRLVLFLLDPDVRFAHSRRRACHAPRPLPFTHSSPSCSEKSNAKQGWGWNFLPAPPSLDFLSAPGRLRGFRLAFSLVDLERDSLRLVFGSSCYYAFLVRGGLVQAPIK